LVLEKCCRSNGSSHGLSVNVDSEDDKGADAEEYQDVDEATCSEPDDYHDNEGKNYRDRYGQKDKFPSLHNTCDLLAVATGSRGDGLPESRGSGQAESICGFIIQNLLKEESYIWTVFELSGSFLGRQLVTTLLGWQSS
jgi:hypothetical protein